ncbi:MAG: hypothetical protein IRZ14_08880 [Chloroflexi bacterium]|mgnify:CR=1 FL=1|nr:hypothetical protein [Chloroflexota bacterium]
MRVIVASDPVAPDNAPGAATLSHGGRADRSCSPGGVSPCLPTLETSHAPPALPGAAAAATQGLAWRLAVTALGALLGVQFPLPWGGLLGALLAALLAELLLRRQLGSCSWLRLLARGAFGCVVGLSLVPALANPALLPYALWPAALLLACWFGGAAIIARVGRLDLLTALAMPAATGGQGRRRYAVLALQQARSLALLLLAAWLAQ